MKRFRQVEVRGEIYYKIKRLAEENKQSISDFLSKILLDYINYMKKQESKD